MCWIVTHRRGDWRWPENWGCIREDVWIAQQQIRRDFRLPTYLWEKAWRNPSLQLRKLIGIIWSRNLTGTSQNSSAKLEYVQRGVRRFGSTAANLTNQRHWTHVRHPHGTTHTYETRTVTLNSLKVFVSAASSHFWETRLKFLDVFDSIVGHLLPIPEGSCVPTIALNRDENQYLRFCCAYQTFQPKF